MPRATSGGPDWDGIAQVAQQSFVEPVNTVFGFVRVIDGHYLGAEFIGVERPDSSLLSVKRGIGQLVTEDFEVASASRYVALFFDTTGLAAASGRAKVDRWIADGRIVVHNDPEVIPAWRPPDHDQPVEQSAAAWPRRRVHRRVASTITLRSENGYS